VLLGGALRRRTLDLRLRQAPQAAVVAWALFRRGGAAGARVAWDGIEAGVGRDMATAFW
jgi:hypothetical protein